MALVFSVDAANTASFDPATDITDTTYYLENGLISYWKLNNLSSSVVPDSLNVGNGTPTDITFVSGKIDNAASFNGSTSKIVLPNSSSYQQLTFTISAWIKTTNTGYREIFQSYSQTYGPYGFEFRMNNNNHLEMVIGYNGSYTAAESTSAINTGEFIHVAGTYDGYYIKLYVNGILEKKVLWTTGINYAGDNVVRIGVNDISSGPYYFWDGLIDEVGFWSRPLVTKEIQNLYNAGVGKTYPLGTFSGDVITTWRDISGNSNDITFSSSPSWLSGAFIFSDSEQYGYFSDAALPATGAARTIEAWVRDDIATGAYQTIIAYGTTAYNQGNSLSFYPDLRMSFSGYANDLVETTARTINKWYYVVGTFDGTTSKLYMNGVLVASSNFSWSTTKTGLAYVSNNSALDQTFKGKIASINIYDSVLSAEDVIDNYISKYVQYVNSLNETNLDFIDPEIYDLDPTQKNRLSLIEYKAEIITEIQPLPIGPSQHAPKPTKL